LAGFIRQPSAAGRYGIASVFGRPSAELCLGLCQGFYHPEIDLQQAGFVHVFFRYDGIPRNFRIFL
jgi:hypothetical protein